MIRSTTYFCLVLAVLSVCASGSVAAESAKRPNILFLFSDDQRFDTIAALGNPEIKTPHLDELVRRGCTFTHTFVQGSTLPAVCLPSRAMLMSGQSLYRLPQQLDRAPLLPALLREAGYQTYGIGKWHNGRPAYARAFDQGASVFFGGMHNHRAIPVYPHDGSGTFPKSSESITDQFSTEIFADSAIQFLRQLSGDDPFFLYVSFTAPHDPRTPPKEFADLYDPEKIQLPPNFLPQHPFDNGEMTIRDEALAPWPRTPENIRQHIADYYGMISHLDAQIGRILQALKESGREKDTIIIFASDNGLAVGQHGLLGKQSLYDHSVRVPLVIAGHGFPENQKTDAFCYLFDLMPTLLAIGGAKVPSVLDGKDLREALPAADGSSPPFRDTVFNSYRHIQRSVRDRQYKLIRYPQINYTQLFDLKADPYEQHDLADDPDQAERVASYLQKLADLQKEFDDSLPLTSANPKPKEIDLTGHKVPR